jgi:hypothetical protein
MDNIKDLLKSREAATIVAGVAANVIKSDPKVVGGVVLCGLVVYGAVKIYDVASENTRESMKMGFDMGKGMI